MKLTCLSKGQGYYYPPCHILEVGGFRILLECPIDLSALAIFSPVPADSFSGVEEVLKFSTGLSLEIDQSPLKRHKVDKQLDHSQLIHVVPWYKTVSSLHVWNASSIDVVLISSPMGMLGLPFLTCCHGFSAKIYATDVTKKLGELVMEDLVTMHKDFEQFYGPESDFPQWMKWEELELLAADIKNRLLGKDAVDLGGWSSLYSIADVKDCIRKVQSVKYAEEVCYNGSMVIKASSSGLDIGTSNWSIDSPTGNAAYLSASLFSSACATHFDYAALENSDVLIYSDCLSVNDIENSNYSNHGVETGSSPGSDESLEEAEKLAFICSCTFDYLKAGGSVLVTLGQPIAILQLLDQISLSPEFRSLKVPIFFVSAVSEEFLSFTNIIPEWLSKQKQEKLFAGEPLFAHADLLNQRRLHIFPSICSPELIKLWQEPCIVFCPHWSLRLGPVVHLLRRWRENENSLLVMEKGVDNNLALLPFKPLKMRVLQCSFRSGIRLQKIIPLLRKLHPKFVLLPEDFKTMLGDLDFSSLAYYGENETLSVPSVKEYSKLEIHAELASQLRRRNTGDKRITISKLKGNLITEHGKHQLLLGDEPSFISRSRSSVHWGSVDAGKLLAELQKLGINGSIDQATSDESGSNFSVQVIDPNKALIQVKPTSTMIKTDDEHLGNLIFDAIDNILDGI